MGADHPLPNPLPGTVNWSLQASLVKGRGTAKRWRDSKKGNPPVKNRFRSADFCQPPFTRGPWALLCRCFKRLFEMRCSLESVILSGAKRSRRIRHFPKRRTDSSTSQENVSRVPASLRMTQGIGCVINDNLSSCLSNKSAENPQKYEEISKIPLDKRSCYSYNTKVRDCGQILAPGATGGQKSKRRCKQHG